MLLKYLAEHMLLAPLTGVEGDNLAGIEVDVQEVCIIVFKSWFPVYQFQNCHGVEQ
jgi:hypothetical protein